MKVKIVILECSVCPHQDHSGMFTTGGAYPICSKTKAPHSIHQLQENPDYKGPMRILPWVVGEDHNGQPTRKATGVIPDWCPLPEDK